MRYDVWAVVQDPGETNGMLPVVDELRKGGHSVRLLASGKALEILKGGAREYCEVALGGTSFRFCEAGRRLYYSKASGVDSLAGRIQNTSPITRSPTMRLDCVQSAPFGRTWMRPRCT
jgi:hypothetical protein